MFVDFKFSTVKAQVSAYWNVMQNLALQFSVADFHFVKFNLLLLVSKGHKIQAHIFHHACLFHLLQLIYFLIRNWTDRGSNN